MIPTAISLFSIVLIAYLIYRIVSRVMRPGLDGRQIQSKWRRLLDRTDVLILDTETTGLYDRAEIVEIGIIDTTGAVRFDSLSMPIGRIPRTASDVHGLTRPKLKAAGARLWPELHDDVMGLIRSARHVLAYNAPFDARMLRQTAGRHGLSLPSVELLDVLADYRLLRPGGSHSLNSAVKRENVVLDEPAQLHRAISDCRLVLGLMRMVADQDDSEFEQISVSKSEQAPTARQLAFIERLIDERDTDSMWSLNYNPKTKSEASDLIDELLELPTRRA